MQRKVLILGGYGNFGSLISKNLIKNNIPIIIAGKNYDKALALKNKLQSDLVDIAIFDIYKNLSEYLTTFKPYIVINTCGPFQNNDYNIALKCVEYNIHYIDLADAREFVTEFSFYLDNVAKQKNIVVITGASTVPTLSSAIIENYKSNFKEIEFVKYGISTAQQTPRGLSTTKAILSYTGKKLKKFSGIQENIYGWQNIYIQNYPIIGKRWLANCDIPDLDLLPAYYNIQKIQFSAGLEISILHLGLWIISWFVRLGIDLNLSNYAKFLLKISNFFDVFGSKDSAMHMIIKGIDFKNKTTERKFFLIAQNGDGLNIPTIPSVILVKKILENKLPFIGATPCIGLITLQEYLDEIKKLDLNIRVID